ncbi:MAG: hypothetical protein HZB36_08510 [Candidatus Omnitrophica bacterium]|nr:hypothetical protein [Candidatus Omnitrophota bacterium]
MAKRVVFFYFMKKEPDKIREIVSAHIAYWKNNNYRDYMGGPFADRSGGLITFEANDIEEATKIINKDPFIINGLIETKWIKEWMSE